MSRVMKAGTAPDGDADLPPLCPQGHPTIRRATGGWRCPDCANTQQRQRHELLAAAARHLGLTQAEYVAAHGKGQAAAQQVLAGPPGTPRPDRCRNGHLWTPETTGWKTRSDRPPHRYCMACRRGREADLATGIQAAARAEGVSAAEWIRRNGRHRSVVAAAAVTPADVPPAAERIDRHQRRAAQRATVRAAALGQAGHVTMLDPDQRDWDGLSVLALCSCGWRETHPTPAGARTAVAGHLTTRPDSMHVRGDRVERTWQTA